MRIKFVIPILVLVLLSSLVGCGARNQTPTFMREDFNLEYIRKIAVMPFEKLGGTAEGSSQRVREITTTQILASGLFDVVDRGLVDRMLRDDAINPGSPLDTITLKRLGQRLGVQAFMMGSVDQTVGTRGSAVYPEISLTLRLIDSETGMVLWQASGRGSGYSLADRLFGVEPKNSFRVTLELVSGMLSSIR